jgi:hypothetical protein
MDIVISPLRKSAEPGGKRFAPPAFDLGQAIETFCLEAYGGTVRHAPVES